MDIGISTASYFNKMQTEDAVLDLARHGVDLCEIFLNSFCEYTPDYIDLLSVRMKDVKLRVYSVHPMGAQFEPQLFSLHSQQRADAWKIYERILACCKQLHAGYYVMHGPASLSGAARHIGVERVAPIFSDLADLAKEYGVQLTLENVSWCIFRDPAFGIGLSERLTPGKLKYTLDIKQAVRSGHSPLEFISALGEDMVNLHLCDALVEADGVYHLKMPGHGNVDLAAVRDRLLKKGYTGPAFIEVYSDMFSNKEELYQNRLDMIKLFNS